MGSAIGMVQVMEEQCDGRKSGERHTFRSDEGAVYRLHLLHVLCPLVSFRLFGINAAVVSVNVRSCP